MPISFFTIKQKIFEVWNHSGFQKYFRNTGWMFAGQIFSLLISFFIGAWLVRYLGPENFGIVSYSIAFVGLFNFIAYLGIHSILLRDLIKYPDKKNELLGTSFTILSVSSLAAFILVIISVFIFESSWFIHCLIILYASSFLFSSFGVISIFFQSITQAKKNVSIGIFTSIISSILKIILIMSGRGIIWLMLIFVLESALNSVLFISIYKKSGFKFNAWKFNKEIAKNILSGAWMLTIAGAASYIFVRVDQIMIKMFLGETSVGLYAAAIKFIEIWYFVPGIICTSLLPAIINAKTVSKEKYFSRLKKLYLLLGGIALIISVFSNILAPWAINVLFGADYVQSIKILRIYIWSGIGYFLNVGFYQYFLAENQLKVIFYFYLFLMLLNIILNYILINIFGFTGAAWATLISYSVGPFLALFFRKILIKKYL